MNEPATDVPPCATMSISQKPGCGSFQSLKVRIGTSCRMPTPRRCRGSSIGSPTRSPTTSTWPCSPIEPDGTSPATLRVLDNISLIQLPSYSPELDPVERVWLYLKERFLSHRLLADYGAIAEAACHAWNRLTAEAGRITSLCSYPWILKVKP